MPEAIAALPDEAQTLDLEARGLMTHPNPLKLPKGALLKALNVVIDRENTIETRRGFGLYGDELTLTGSNFPNKFFNYKDSLILHYGSKLAYDSDDAGTWVDYSGTYDPPSGANRIRGIEANENFYFTTDEGVKKLDAVTADVVAAGAPKGLDGEGSVSGSSGFMTDDTQVAYRIVWGYTDENNNRILGAPSDRIIVSNSAGGTRDVDLDFSIPENVTTDYFYQIYRSGESASASDEPNDELQLVVEKSPTSGQITAKAVTYTDKTPNSLRGATLYTSPSQQGILQANDTPPIAKDITLYKGLMLYANTTSKHRLNLTLISVGSPDGIQVDDTITIAGTTYTGKATENVANAEFDVDTSGTPAANIAATARSLVRVINQHTGNTSVYAYYISGFEDLPGQILIEERDLGGSEFVAISDRGGAFSPELPSSGSTYASSNDRKKNGIYVSKFQQPEAVPLTNLIFAGSGDKEILRIIALRDSVFILKEDGIFRITGETITDIRVSLFDESTKIIAEDSAVAFNNQVVFMSEQGVAAASDSGVAIVSRQIEQTILQLTNLTNFTAATFGIAYESDRKYILSTVSVEADTYAVQQFVYNSATNSWTRWNRPINSGIVSDRDNKLYLGSANSSFKYVYQERKNYNTVDNADEEYDVTITAHTGTTVTVNSTTGLVAGMSLVQFKGTNPIRNSVITEVTDATTLVVRDTVSWENTSAKVYTPIESEVQFSPVHGGNPSILKHFSEMMAMFSNANFDRLTATFTSDLSVSLDTVILFPKTEGPWGLFPWGGVGWGGEQARTQPIRTLIPREKARANWINVEFDHAQALTKFAMVGLSIFFEPLSTRRK